MAVKSDVVIRTVTGFCTGTDNDNWILYVPYICSSSVWQAVITILDDSLSVIVINVLAAPGPNVTDGAVVDNNKRTVSVFSTRLSSS